MSYMSDEELDYNRIVKGLLNLKGLYLMKEKYKDKPKILKEIQKRIDDYEKEER